MNLLLDKRAWLFSAKCYLAALLALLVGLWGPLPRPYWAMSTVYIVFQPMLGGTRSRVVHRIAGTLIASVAIVAMLPPLSQSPLLLAAALSMWLSLCLCLALRQRGPSSYIFLLASYTTAFVGFPAVAAPDTIFEVALARSEEIIVGAVAAGLVASLVFPETMKAMIGGRVAAWLDDAAAWCTQVLRGDGHRDARRGRLAADLGQFEHLIATARRDDPRHPRRHAHMRELRARMLELLPVLAGITDRLDTLHDHARIDADLARLIDDVEAWLHAKDADAAHADALLARIDARRPRLSPDTDTLLVDSLLVRLRELVVVWRQCRELQADIDRDDDTRDARTDAPRVDRAIEARHVDLPLLLFSAFSAGATVFAYCVLWWWSGDPAGGLGAMMVAVGTAFFAGTDDPVPNIMTFLTGTLAATLLAGVYLFGVFPVVQTFGMLALVLAPAYLLLGLLVYRPATMMIGLIMLANLSTLLGVQGHYAADFQSYVNNALAMILGLLFAIVATALFRSLGADWTARRLVRRGWSLLADAASGHGEQDRLRFTGRMLDLLGLATPRLAATTGHAPLAAVDLLEETRIGLNILQLRRARRELPEPSATHADALLAGIAAHYRAQARAGHPLEAPECLRDDLDASLSRLGSLAPGEARDAALLGLVGVRYGLFGRRPAQNQPIAVAAQA